MAYFQFLPNTSLTNENEEKTTFHDVISDDGRIVLISMFYASCAVKCLPSGRILARANKLLGDLRQSKKIHFALISLDPEGDSVDDLSRFKATVRKPYGRKENKDDVLEQFSLYRARSFAELERLRKAIGMFNVDPVKDADKSQHDSHYLLVNSRIGQVRHISGFRNPIEICSKLLRYATSNLPTHIGHVYLSSLRYHLLDDDTLTENASSVNNRYTLPYLPAEIREKIKKHADGRLIPLESDRRRFGPGPGPGPGTTNTTQSQSQSQSCCCCSLKK